MFRDASPGVRAPGTRNRSPDACSGMSIYEVLWNSQTSTLSHYFHRLSMMVALPFSIHKRCPCVRMTGARDGTDGKSSNSIMVTKTSESLTYTAASFVNLAIPLAFMMTVRPLHFLMVSFSPRVTLFLLVMWIDAPISTMNSRFFTYNLTEMRQTSLDVSCSVIGRIVHMPRRKFL